jgi:hypothetical protein
MWLAAGALIVAAANPAQSQIDIAVTRLAVDPAAPVAGQPATLTATLHSRQLSPRVLQLETVNVRILFTRTVQRQPQRAAEVAVGQQRGTLRIGEDVTVSVPWIAEAGSQAFTARVEVEPGQGVRAQDLRVSNDRATARINVAAAAAPTESLQPVDSDAGRRFNRDSDRRRVTTAALGAVGVPAAPATEAEGDLVIDVPVYVYNGGDLHALEVRCSVFGQGSGDALGNGHVERAISGGTISETVSVPIELKAGKRQARATRYSCQAFFIQRGQGSDRDAPAARGATGANDRRQEYERQLGRRLVAFSDRVDGDIARR